MTHMSPTMITLGPAGRHITQYIMSVSVLNGVNTVIRFLVKLVLRLKSSHNNTGLELFRIYCKMGRGSEIRKSFCNIEETYMSTTEEFIGCIHYK